MMTFKKKIGLEHWRVNEETLERVCTEGVMELGDLDLEKNRVRRIF